MLLEDRIHSVTRSVCILPGMQRCFGKSSGKDQSVFFLFKFLLMAFVFVPAWLNHYPSLQNTEINSLQLSFIQTASSPLQYRPWVLTSS